MVINDNATSFFGDMQKNCENRTLVLSFLSTGFDKIDQHHT